MSLAALSTHIVTASIVLVMMLSGALLDPAVFRAQFNRTTMKEFLKLIIASSVAIPAVVIALLWLAPLDEMVKLVLITLAILPCAPVIPAMAVICDEPPEWALFLLIATSIMNLGAVFVLVGILRVPWLAGESASLSGEQLLGIITFLGVTYVPMAIGFALRYITPTRLPRIIRFLRSLMGPFLILSFVFYMAAHYEDLLHLGVREFLGLAGLEAVCVIAALLVMPGVPANHRVTTMLACTMRNFAMGIAFTTTVFAGTSAPAIMMAFTTILFWVVALSLGVYKRRTASQRAANSA